jgi:ribosomal protein S18 acetylase RimI-like enzyme
VFPVVAAAGFAIVPLACYDHFRFRAAMALIQITIAQPADYEWCARLMASSEPWITLQRDLEGCRRVLNRPGTELFVARDELSGDSVGFVLLAPYGLAGSPYIASIAVAPGLQDQGVGSQLIRFTEQRYCDRAHLFLLVSSFNPRAQRFYRRHGFEFVGELKDYIVPHHSELIFHKHLA